MFKTLKISSNSYVYLDHNTQRILIIIRLLEEWRTNLDNNFLARVIFMDPSKFL